MTGFGNIVCCTVFDILDANGSLVSALREHADWTTGTGFSLRGSGSKEEEEHEFSMKPYAHRRGNDRDTSFSILHGTRFLYFKRHVFTTSRDTFLVLHGTEIVQTRHRV